MMRNKQLVTELVVDECLVGMPLKTRKNLFLYPSRQPYWAFGVGIEIGKLRSGLLRVEGRIDNWMKLGRRRSATQMTMHNSGCAKEEGSRAPHRLLVQPGHTTTKPCISLSRVATKYQASSVLPRSWGVVSYDRYFVANPWSAVMILYRPTKAQCGRINVTTSLFWGRGWLGCDMASCARGTIGQAFSHDSEKFGMAKRVDLQ